MSKLSPAAQAIFNASTSVFWRPPIDVPAFQNKSVAATLRAAANQVVPWQPEPTEESVGPTIDFGYAWALFSKANDVRQKLLAIADELETQ